MSNRDPSQVFDAAVQAQVFVNAVEANTAAAKHASSNRELVTFRDAANTASDKYLRLMREHFMSADAALDNRLAHAIAELADVVDDFRAGMDSYSRQRAEMADMGAIV